MTCVKVGCQATEISVTLVHVASQPLAEVVGRNCKRLRIEIGLTQDQLAQYARTLGLRWNAAKVGDFEAGRSAPTFATVLLVGITLHFASARAAMLGPLYGKKRQRVVVTLADLLDGGGLVELTDELWVPASGLADVCRGKAFPLDWYKPAVEPETPTSLTEDRLTKSLGINRSRLADVSFQLWQRTFSEERDRRAGPGANRQKRGRVSRELRAELEKALADGNNK
jgi:transcriptional regulator with XRE-family HTH domain